MITAIKHSLGIAFGVLLGLLATAGLICIVAVLIDIALEARVQQLVQRNSAAATGGAL